MSKAIEHLLTFLVATPVGCLFVTIGAYVIGRVAQRACRNSSFVSPVLVAIAVVSAVLQLTGTSYSAYFARVQFINLLLGPATIALAVPLAKNVVHVRNHLCSLCLALMAGSVTSIISGVVIARMLGGSRTVALSIAPKAVTTPIAMAVSRQIGGIPALTAVLSIAGGTIAAIVGQQILHRLRIHDWKIRGLAAGVAGSGIAAAQISCCNQLAAAFAALGICLNGLLTAVLIPLLISIWR